MTLMFPYGFLSVGDVYDEIDFVHAIAYSRITRLEYTEENRASAEASGRAYTFDEDYIYLERSEPVTNAVTIENEYAVSEHGMEFIDGSTIPIYTEILYGANLKDKLKRDVLTISEQTLTGAQQAQVQRNLGVPSSASVNENIAKQRTAMSYVVDGNVSADAIPAGAYFQLVNSQITGRSDGEYTASKAIPANTAIDNTYFTQTAPISGGAVNALNSKLANIVKYIDKQYTSQVPYFDPTFQELIGKQVVRVSALNNGEANPYDMIIWNFNPQNGKLAGYRRNIQNGNYISSAQAPITFRIFYID